MKHKILFLLSLSCCFGFSILNSHAMDLNELGADNNPEEILEGFNKKAPTEQKKTLVNLWETKFKALSHAYKLKNLDQDRIKKYFLEQAKKKIISVSETRKNFEWLFGLLENASNAMTETQCTGLAEWLNILPEMFFIPSFKDFCDSLKDSEKHIFFEQTTFLASLYHKTHKDLNNKTYLKSSIDSIPDYLFSSFKQWLNLDKFQDLLRIFKTTPFKEEHFINLFLEEYLFKTTPKDYPSSEFTIKDSSFDKTSTEIKEANESLLRFFKKNRLRKDIDLMYDGFVKLTSGTDNEILKWWKTEKQNITWEQLKRKSYLRFFSSEEHLLCYALLTSDVFKKTPEEILEILSSRTSDELKNFLTCLDKIFSCKGLLSLDSSTLTVFTLLTPNLKKAFKEWFNPNRILEILRSEKDIPLFYNDHHFLSFFLQDLKKTPPHQIRKYFGYVFKEKLHKDNDILISFFELLFSEKVDVKKIQEIQDQEKTIHLPGVIEVTDGREAYQKKMEEGGIPSTLILSAQDLKLYLSHYVKGQDQALEEIVWPLHQYLLMLEKKRQNPSCDFSSQKPNCLLVGPTGCGKTEILRTVAKLFRMPVFMVNSAELTKASYIGVNLEDAMWRFFDEAVEARHITLDPSGKTWHFPDGAIIFLDELGKLGIDKHSKGVQAELLKVIEGQTFQRTDKWVKKMTIDALDKKEPSFTTHNILFIGADAFAGLIKPKETIKENILAEKSGLLPELLGRFPNIIRLAPLGLEQLRNILTDSAGSILKRCQSDALMDPHNLVLEFSEGALTEIARRALLQGMGARPLNGVVSTVFSRFYKNYDKKKGLKILKVSKETIENIFDNPEGLAMTERLIHHPPQNLGEAEELIKKLEESHDDLEKKAPFCYFPKLSQPLKDAYKKWFNSKRLLEIFSQTQDFSLFKSDEALFSFFLQDLKGTPVHEIQKYLKIVSVKELKVHNQILQDFLNTLFKEGLNLEAIQENSKLKQKDLLPGLERTEQKDLPKIDHSHFIPLPLNDKDMKLYLSCYIRGQDQAIEQIVWAVYSHQINLERKKRDPNFKMPLKPNSFLIGATGTGKTEICRKLSELLKMPILICDTTKLVDSGHGHNTIKEQLLKLHEKAVKDGHVVEYDPEDMDQDGVAYAFNRGAIIFLDELDKIKNRENLQSEILKTIEGDEQYAFSKENPYNENKDKNKIFIRSDNILFIASGAFTGKVNHKERISVQELCEKGGMKKELIGRFPNLIQLNPLKLENLIDILEHSASSPLKTSLEISKSQYDLHLTFTKEAITHIAERAFKQETGARALPSIVGPVVQEICFRYGSEIGRKDFEVGVETIKHILNVNQNSCLDDLESLKKMDMKYLKTKLEKTSKNDGEFIMSLLVSVKQHYSRLLEEKKRGEEAEGREGKLEDRLLVIDHPNENKVWKILETLTEELKVPFATLNIWSAINSQSGPKALYSLYQNLSKEALEKGSNVGNGIALITGMENLISRDSNAMKEYRIRWNDFLENTRLKKLDSHLLKEMRTGESGGELSSFSPKNLFFIFSAQPVQSAEWEILTQPFFQEVLGKSFNQLIVLKKETTESLENQLQAENSCLKQELSRLEEDHSIKIKGFEITCEWLCDWVSKNTFEWSELKNAVLTLSKKIEEEISFGEIENEFELDAKFLKEKILPKLPKKNGNPAHSMYL